MEIVGKDTVDWCANAEVTSSCEGAVAMYKCCCMTA